MREALERVKRELGPDAIILGTRSLPASGLRGLAGRQRVEITAAPPTLPSPAPRLRPEAADRPVAQRAKPSAPDAKVRLSPQLYPYYVQLVQNEVAEELAAQLVQRAAAGLPGNDAVEAAALRNALREYIARMLPEAGGVNLEGTSPRRVALVGPSGAGKTTTVAKLAAHFKLRHGRRVALLSLDTHRLAAHEQLRRYAEVIGVPLHAAQTISEVKQCVKGLANVDLLLIDTPGVGLREQGRFARLATLLRAARPDETHLVLPASLEASVQARVAQSLAPLGITRAVLTRLDDAIGFGVILNVVQRLNLSVSYVTTGQNVPNDIEEASGARLAEMLLRS